MNISSVREMELPLQRALLLLKKYRGIQDSLLLQILEESETWRNSQQDLSSFLKETNITSEEMAIRNNILYDMACADDSAKTGASVYYFQRCKIRHGEEKVDRTLRAYIFFFMKTKCKRIFTHDC